MAPTKVQQKNRNERFKSIIRTAESLFIQQGLDNVQMQHIADAEDIGIATLFRYFPRKEKLIVAVAVYNLERAIPDLKKIVSVDKSAYERLENVLDYLAGDNTVKSERSAKFREAFESSASFAKEPFEDIESYIAVQKEIAYIFLRIVEDGKKDGSIRSGIPVKETLITIINAYGIFGNNITLKSAISYLEDDIAPHIQRQLLKEMLLTYIRPVD